MGDKILDPALGLNQRIGAKALDRRGAGKDRAGAATLRNEATGKILIRCRRLGFPSDPFAQIPCAPPRKGAIAVDSAKVRQMLVPGLLARGIEERREPAAVEVLRPALRRHVPLVVACGGPRVDVSPVLHQFLGGIQMIFRKCPHQRRLAPERQTILHAGNGAQTSTSSRWGDYSHLSLDPRDDCTFWFTSEYVETTGTDPKMADLVEIAAVKVVGGKVADSWSTFVNPGRTIVGHQMHGITDKDVKGAPSPKEAAQAFMKFAGDATIVGHSVGFDLGFIEAALGDGTRFE